MRKAPFERIDDEEMPLSARKGLHQHFVGGGKLGTLGLDAQPFAHGIGQRAPLLRVGDHAAHALGEMRRERELAAGVGGDGGVGIAGAGDEGVGVLQALEAEHLAGESERVARFELLDEGFFQLAQHAAAHQRARHAGF